MNILIENREAELKCLMSKAQRQVQVIAREKTHMGFKYKYLISAKIKILLII